MVDKEKRKSSGCEEYVKESRRERERKIVERTRAIAETRLWDLNFDGKENIRMSK